MNYKGFPDKDLLESYSTALDYSSRPDKDLVTEIERRGGIDQVKRNIDEQNIVPDEINRINKLVYSLYKDEANPDKIKLSITSDILSAGELRKTINIALISIEQHIEDTSLNSRTIIGSIIGVIISSLMGAGIWYYSIIQTGKMYYVLTPGILIISYIIIRLLTKQSKNNALVFIGPFASAFMAIILGLWFYKLALN